MGNFKVLKLSNFSLLKNVFYKHNTLEWIYLSNIIIYKIKKMTPKNYNEFSSHFFGFSFLFFRDNFVFFSIPFWYPAHASYPFFSCSLVFWAFFSFSFIYFIIFLLKIVVSLFIIFLRLISIFFKLIDLS